MTEIRNVEVYELFDSIIACRNPMRTTWATTYSEEEYRASLKRAIKLVQASKNGVVKCHDNFLTGIRVSFDIKYPNYLSPELQRYHFLDIVSSSSKMHRLTNMDMDACFNEYVCIGAKEMMKELLAQYAQAETMEDKYKAFMRLVSNCPLGVELFMRVSTNYKQLQTIYFQRKNHKLKEDWGAIIQMIEQLPLAHELIIGDKTDVDL